MPSAQTLQQWKGEVAGAESPSGGGRQGKIKGSGWGRGPSTSCPRPPVLLHPCQPRHLLLPCWKHPVVCPGTRSKNQTLPRGLFPSLCTGSLTWGPAQAVPSAWTISFLTFPLNVLFILQVYFCECISDLVFNGHKPCTCVWSTMCCFMYMLCHIQIRVNMSVSSNICYFFTGKTFKTLLAFGNVQNGVVTYGHQ